MITITFDKLYNKPRMNQPAAVSIPFARGVLFDENQVKLYQGNKQLQIQPRVLSYYKDGSIRYLFIRFLADLPENQKATVLCDWKGEVEIPVYAAATEQMLSCKKTTEGYEVCTGAMRFRVQNQGQHLFSDFEACKVAYDKEQFFGPALTIEGEEHPLLATYGDWEVVEEGTVCVILSNKGKVEEGLVLETRLTAFSGGTTVEIEYRLINATDEEKRVTSYVFCYQNPKEENVRTCVADSNYKTNFLLGEHGETVEKEITAEFLINQSNEHFAEVFYGTFFSDYVGGKQGVCAMVYQAHQNFPKALVAKKDGMEVKLIPEGQHAIRIQSGMAVAQRFALFFHAPELELDEINHISTMYQMPDVPIIEARVYAESGLYPDIFVEKEKQDAMVECALMMTADNHTRSYGMMNWGDAPDPHYTAQGRGNGRLVWTNNEYDYPHACMLEFMRTGERRFRDYGIVAGIHQINVDVCHYSKDECLLGGQWEHTDGHCFGEMACSHEWVEGILDCYHLTGDRRFYDTAIGIGENILRLLDTPKYQETGGLNARETGWALRTLTALYRETGEERWNEKSEWIVGQFMDWSARYGGWLAPYLDNTVIRVPFMISVAVGSLMRYYREFPREDLKALMLQAVDDMLENCLMENGYFYYKELPSLNRVGNNPLVLEALTIAYELTGEEAYLKAGKRTFEANISSSLNGGSTGKRIAEDAVLVGNTGTKRFAQMFIPVTTYYKAIVASNLL